MDPREKPVPLPSQAVVRLTWRSFAAFLLPLLFVAGGCASPGRSSLLSPYIKQNDRVYSPLSRNVIAELVEARIASGDADFVSVYYQDLATGYWFGINEKENFIPASLMKLYLAVGIMALSEKEPGLLRQRIAYERPEQVFAQEYREPADALVPGETYTVEQLLRHMLVYSDNVAVELLRDKFEERVMPRIDADFGLNIPGEEKDFISVKQYLMLFLTLYNSTYLEMRDSEKLLGLLLHSKFMAGLAAGLPHGTRVAHKFGERRVEGRSGDFIQLHDCGVIYHPDFPYLLGVMTRGRDMQKQAAVIRDISALIYQELGKSARPARR